MAKGHQAAIVHPGFMLGPWDWKPSSGRMILEVAKRWTPLAPAGGCSVCDVRDVAQGVLAVLERSAFGRQFILAGDNLTYFDLWNRFAKALGKTGPLTTLRLPGQWLAGLFGDTISRFMSQESDLNSAAIRMSSQYHWYSSQKAMRELDYQPRPAQEAIRAAIDWFQQRRYL
jgi:dihydroflavonol-4-reductase